MSSSFRNGALLAGAMLSGVLVAPGKAWASNWDFEPRVEVGALYNDNYRLIEHNQPRVPAYGVLADVAMGFSLIDQRSELDFIPRVHSSFFPDDHEDQSTDGYVNIIGNFKTEKASYGGTFNYANETVLSSELLPADFPGVNLGQTQGETNGRVTLHNRRQLEQVAPKMTYDFTQRWHLDANAMFENASFTNNITSNQTKQYAQIGFKDIYGAAGAKYNLTQRQDITFRFNAGEFIPDKVTVLGTGPTATRVNTNTTNTERYGIEGLWEAKPSTTMQTYVRAGISQVHASTAVYGNIDKTLFVGGVNMDQCVMTTLEDASFLGYDTVLVEDGTATTSPDYCVKAVLFNVKRLFGFIARSEAILGAIKSA